MKITLLFLLIALIAITTLVKADVDEDFDLDAPETGIEDRELWYYSNPWSWYKTKKKGDGKLHARAYVYLPQTMVDRTRIVYFPRTPFWRKILNIICSHSFPPPIFGSPKREPSISFLTPFFLPNNPLHIRR